MCVRAPGPSVRGMKTLLALAAVAAALTFTATAGAMPIYDAYPEPTAAPVTPARQSDHTALWAAVAGGVAFVLGAGSARLVRFPRRAAA
jgi:hypothetical protein